MNHSMDQCFGANHNYIVGGFLSVSEPTLPLSLSVNFNFLMYLLGFLFFIFYNVTIVILEGLGQSFIFQNFFLWSFSDVIFRERKAPLYTFVHVEFV